MGKWCFMNVKLPSDLYERKVALTKLSEMELEQRWVAAGSPTMEQHGLSWYSGVSGDGWACIDNSAGAKDFQMFADRQDFLHNTPRRLYWERLACTLATEIKTQHSIVP